MAAKMPLSDLKCQDADIDHSEPFLAAVHRRYIKVCDFEQRPQVLSNARLIVNNEDFFVLLGSFSDAWYLPVYEPVCRQQAGLAELADGLLSGMQRQTPVKSM